MPSAEGAVVADSTPIIAFADVGQLALLHRLFRRGAGAACGVVRGCLLGPRPRRGGSHRAGSGDRRPLGHYRRPAGAPARERLGLALTGTFGVLIAAKKKGYLEEVGPLVELLAENSIYSSPGKLTDRVVGWAEDAGVEVPGVRRKLRFVGVIRRTHTSPNTVRWHQHAAWLAAFRRSAVQSVSAPAQLWDYLIASQAKVADWNPPWRWSDPALAEPPREPYNLAALRLAAWVFDTGCVTAEQLRFSDLLCRQHPHRFAWCRRLVAQLRRLA